MSYIDEDGIFYSGTETAIVKFKDHFNVDNTKANTNNSFNKLIKDYNHEAVRAYWSNKIVDKETLVGSQFTTTERVVNQNDSGDTGLYELYENGVKVFVDAMLTEAERYITAPTQNWVARTGETATGTDTHGPGMSYCFGCKQDIATFNSTVAPDCPPETQSQITARETPIDGDEYRGNVKNENGNCQVVTTGGLRWVGLKRSELLAYRGDVNVGSNPVTYQWNGPISFKPQYWAGIDCSGFVQRAVNGGRDDVADLSVTIPASVGTQTSQDIFTVPKQVYYQARVNGNEARKKQQRKLRKGDLVRYSGHISIIYSDKPKEDGSYQIIHAYGTRLTNHDDDTETPTVFTRKVVIT